MSSKIEVGSQVVATGNRAGVVTEIRASEEPFPPFAMVRFGNGQSELLATNALKLASEVAEQIGADLQSASGDMAAMKAEVSRLTSIARENEELRRKLAELENQ